MSRTELALGGLYNSFDQTKVPQGRCWSMQNATVLRGVVEGSPRYSLFGARSGTDPDDIGWGAGHGKFASNAIQRLSITGSPTGGTFTITFDGQTTGAIAFDASAIDVLSALEALSNITIGDVKVTGGDLPSEYIDIEFRGQYANTSVDLMTTTDSLTGGSSPASSIAHQITGGTNEVYLVMVQHTGESTATLYSVDASDGTYTQLGTGFHASDWYFQQYGDKIWFINAADGLKVFQLGGTYGAAPSISSPTIAPVLSYTYSWSWIDFSSGFASITQSGLGGAPTVTGTATGISITNGAVAVTAQTEVTVTATYSAAQDFSFTDVWQILVQSGSSSDAVIAQGAVRLDLINNDGTPATISPIAEAHPTRGTATFAVYWAHFGNSERTLRDNTLKLQIKFTVDSWAASKQVTIRVTPGYSWMLDKVPFEFVSAIADPAPTTGKIRYAYAYYDAANLVESNLSEEVLTSTIPPGPFGAYVTLELRGSSELTGSDRIFVYRQEKVSGEWRRLPVDANTLNTYGVANVTSGTTTYTDKWMEEDLKSFPSRSAPVFTSASSTLQDPAIGVWKQSLVIGSNRKLWLSFVGIPQRFAPDPDDKDAVIEFNQVNSDNPDVGRTVYLSDDRAEEVYAVFGQDSLYGVGPVSSYAIVGDSPLESSPPRRLPGSRGAVGTRAAFRYKGGIEVASDDGLFYYAVGRGFSGEDNGALVEREETEEVRTSYTDTLLGSSYSDAIVVEHNDEIWLFNGTKYLRNNRNRSWEEGTFADSVKCAIPVRSRGLRFSDVRGRLHTISEDYSTDNGASVNWSYNSGLLEGPRAKITDLEVHVVGVPRVTVHTYSPFGNVSDDYGTYEVLHFDTPDTGSIWRLPLSIQASQRYRVILSGTAGADKVTALAIHHEPVGKAYGG